MVQDPETKGGYLRKRARSRAVRVPTGHRPQHYSNAMQAGPDTGQARYVMEEKPQCTSVYHVQVCDFLTA